MKRVGGLLGKEIRAVNIGLPSFADDLEAQGVQVTRVDWKPPAGGRLPPEDACEEAESLGHTDE
ncbi:MAG: hypothetical protein ABSB29_05435 [Nitrososphaerales archaeon]